MTRGRRHAPVPGAAFAFAAVWGAMLGAFAGPWGAIFGIVFGAMLGHRWRPRKKHRVVLWGPPPGWDVRPEGDGWILVPPGGGPPRPFRPLWLDLIYATRNVAVEKAWEFSSKQKPGAP